MRRTWIPAAAAAAMILAGCAGKDEEPQAGPPPTVPPPAAQPAGGPPGPSGVDAGKAIYLANCASCHLETGRGKMKDQPDFTSADWQKDHDDAEIAAYVRDGEGAMPAFKDKLTEEQIASVVKYVRTFPAPTTP